MEGRVGRVPDVVEGNLEVVGTLLTRPDRVQGLDAQAKIVSGVLQQDGNRFVKKSSVVTTFGLRDVVQSVVGVGQTVNADRQVRGRRSVLSKSCQTKTLCGGPGLCRGSSQSKSCQSVRHDVAGVDVQLGVDRGVDGFLTEGDDFVPRSERVVVAFRRRGRELVRLVEGDGPVAVTERRAVRQADDDRLLQVDRRLARTADDHRRKEGFAVLQTGVNGVSDAQEEIDAVAGRQGSGGNGQ